MARSAFVPWDSLPLDEATRSRAPGYTVDLGGRQTHFVKHGAGPAVILVHGFNLDLNAWIANTAALARHFTVYGLDLWGSGYSNRDPLDYGFTLFVEQILALMNHLEIDRAHLVGHSMGGGTTIALSAAHPERVGRVVLVGSVGISRPTTLRERIFQLPWLPELLLNLPTDLIRRRDLLAFWIHDAEHLTAEVFDALTDHQKIEGTTRAALEILRRDFVYELGEKIDTFADLLIPTMIVWGRHDRLIPIESGWEMHNRMPHSRFEVFDRSGHMPNFDEPDRFNDLVVGFLQD